MKRDYDRVTALLEACGMSSSAAELHGMICGQVSSGPAGLRLDLAARLLGAEQALPPAMEELVLRFAAEVATQLGGADFTFQPLLPDEDADLERRVRALGCWCEGFNLGFAAGRAGDGGLPADTREVIADFSRIAELEEGSGLDEPIEQDEGDFAEILEYVRVAAVSVFMQNVPAPATRPGPDDQIH